MESPQKFIKYITFTNLSPIEFPSGTDETMDYMPDENVCPVEIIDTCGNKYTSIRWCIDKTGNNQNQGKIIYR